MPKWTGECKKSGSGKPLPRPTWIPATVQDSNNQDFILKNLVINSERKPLGKESVISEDHTMDALEIYEGVDIGVKRIKKMGTETR